MSNHLIQPIDIDGTLYCCNWGGAYVFEQSDYSPTWRTVEFVYDGDILPDLLGLNRDYWFLRGGEGSPDPTNRSGTIKFATCCLWKATLVAQSPDYVIDTEGLENITYTIRLEINDVLIQEETLTGDQPLEIVVDLNDLGLMGRACGNVWAIYAEADYPEDDNSGIVITIEDVTFGPPV
jgi:hypothetical protein